MLFAADDFAAPSSAGDAEALARLGVRAPCVLMVGAAEKRKNHARGCAPEACGSPGNSAGTTPRAAR